MQTHGAQAIHHAQQSLMLQHLDHAWKDHLLTLDHLRQGINLRAYGQKDPLNEYKHEAFNLFNDMMEVLRGSITASLSHAQFNQQQQREEEHPPFSFEEGLTPELMEQLQQFLGMSMPPEEAEKFGESLRDRFNQEASDFEGDLDQESPRQIVAKSAAPKTKTAAKKGAATKTATQETVTDSKGVTKTTKAKAPGEAVASPAKKTTAKKPTAASQPPEGLELRRNDPCHCGSGFKYKHCHGRI